MGRLPRPRARPAEGAGLIPADATHTLLPPRVRPWNSLSPDEKRLSARDTKAYAAALAYCDDQIGRVIEALRASGRLDVMLVIYVQGDHGAEGSGPFDHAAMGSDATGKADEFSRSLARIDAIGVPESDPGAPLG